MQNLVFVTIMLASSLNAFADHANLNNFKTYKCVWTSTKDPGRAFGLVPSHGKSEMEIIDNNLLAPDATTAVAIAASKIREKLNSSIYFDSDVDCTSY